MEDMPIQVDEAKCHLCCTNPATVTCDVECDDCFDVCEPCVKECDKCTCGAILSCDRPAECRSKIKEDGVEIGECTQTICDACAKDHNYMCAKHVNGKCEPWDSSSSDDDKGSEYEDQCEQEDEDDDKDV